MTSLLSPLANLLRSRTLDFFDAYTQYSIIIVNVDINKWQRAYLFENQNSGFEVSRCLEAISMYMISSEVLYQSDWCARAGKHVYLQYLRWLLKRGWAQAIISLISNMSFLLAIWTEKNNHVYQVSIKAEPKKRFKKNKQTVLIQSMDREGI